MNKNISIVSVSDISHSVSESYFNEVQPGAPTGWHNLDRYYTVAGGQFTVVTGVPSHGKSEFMDALCVNLAVQNGWRILMFSPENYPIEMHVQKLVRKYIGKPYGKMYNGTMSENEAREGIRFINGSFLFIYPGDNLVTVQDLIDVAKTQDIDGFVIDPWNELDHRRPGGLTETEYISMSLGKFRAAARELNIHIWVVAHPKSPQMGRDYKKTPPNLYDVSGGAHWYNKADNGITIHRPDVVDGAETNIHVTKVRFRNIGKPTGQFPVVLNYNIASGRYLE